MLDGAKQLLAILRTNGFDAYIVGGAVRDWLLNQPFHDIDIATSARPEEVQALFSETVPVGLKHGTVLVIHEGIPYEVTTFRSESGYSDFRHPDHVTFETSLDKDLERRDFTINAMALGPDNQVMDPFNGQEDLKNCQLRTVGDAVQRFREDPLRMLRAARFVSQLDFSPTEDLQQAMKREANALQYISIERIQEELTKCMRGRVPYKAFELIASAGLYHYIPSFSKLPETLKSLARIQFSTLKTDVERWCLLLNLMKVELTPTFFKSYRFSSKMKSEWVQLDVLFNKEKSEPLTKELLFHYGLNRSLSVEHLKAALGEPSDETAIVNKFEALPIQSRKDVVVDGKNLMAWTGLKPGPWLADLFTEIEHLILSGQLENSRNPIQRWVQTEWMTRSQKS